ncbi:hormonally up-regulated neu tumor-associated kinase homolog A-like isoform X1 [Polypterus senegalus]|uniref:hormonally up-regulated neu tumor-associated kinase homolog A-like isoform X1 n=2 Tax=Polypterus senegalus TaxID=55291 RepID=UPI0019659148|nr:hormonally up-regulated neu tumor-associated kinase homolog A-like isoform X1 [Polypterus senegalus]
MPVALGEMITDNRFCVEKKASFVDNSHRVVPCVGRATRCCLRSSHHSKRVGNYVIGRKLGEGSFAKVREGLHALTGEKVAVKIIDKKKAKKDSYMTRNLRREGQIQQMIRHPNITQLFDILETENCYYLIMELCLGGSLMQKIYEQKRLEEPEAQKYVKQLMMAVDHLHRVGVVHRDLKIENLLLDEENNIKLIDFGLSNCAGILGYSDPFSTQCGSPAYAAPELLSRKKYGPKVDVWSIGVNMYAMLTGTLPFTVEPFSLRALYQKMVDKEMNPLPPHISTGFAAVNMLTNLLEPNPVKRPDIQQALANQWLNENNQTLSNYQNPYLNRSLMEQLNQNVLVHMTQKMGFKYHEVVNTVLSNRACHTLAVYFLLNKKIQRYSKVLKEVQYKEEDHIHSMLQATSINKNEKAPFTIPQENSSSVVRGTKIYMKDKKQISQDETAILRVFSNSNETKMASGECLANVSLEPLEMAPVFPKTPQPIRKLEFCQYKKDSHLNSCTNHSSHSENRGTNQTESTPWYKFATCALSSKCFKENACNTASVSKKIENKPFNHHINTEEMNPMVSENASSEWRVFESTGVDKTESLKCAKNRGRFPMMGVGQMLKRRNQHLQLKAEKLMELKTPTQKAHGVQETIIDEGKLTSLC